MAITAEVVWFRVKVLVRGLVPEEMEEDIAQLCEYLTEKDYLREVHFNLDIPRRQAVIEAQIEAIRPETAEVLVEDEVVRPMLVIRTLDDVYIESIGVERCEE